MAVSGYRYEAEFLIKQQIHVNVVSVGIQYVSLDTKLYLWIYKHLLVSTLNVAMGTQLKQLCLWIYNTCCWVHRSVFYLNLLRYQILSLTSPHNQSELNFVYLSLKYLDSYSMINKNTECQILNHNII